MRCSKAGEKNRFVAQRTATLILSWQTEHFGRLKIWYKMYGIRYIDVYKVYSVSVMAQVTNVILL